MSYNEMTKYVIYPVWELPECCSYYGLFQGNQYWLSADKKRLYKLRGH